MPSHSLPSQAPGAETRSAAADRGTSIGSFVNTPEAGASMENVAAVLGDFIGGVTLTGSRLEEENNGSFPNGEGGEGGWVEGFG